MEQFMDNDESLLLCTPNTNTKVKFPFFDLPENVNSASRNYEIEARGPRDEGSGLFTPPPNGQGRRFQEAVGYSTPIDSTWESEISPISRNRDSSGGTLDVSSGGLRMTTPTDNQGENLEDIDNMLTELKDIIQQSQKKQNERRQSSTSRRRSADPDFLVDALTRQTHSEDSHGPLSPPFQPVRDAVSPLRTPPPTDTAAPSSGITTTDNVSSATKKVNESSNNFIQRIRDVAQKRKLSMTRSRDNLKAHAKEELRPYNDVDENLNIEEADEEVELDATEQVHADADENALDKRDIGDENALDKTNDSHRSPKPRISLSNKSLNISDTEYHFKARPVPETTGIKGTGGLTGVPKVEKRPTTTPFSPLLGSRRPEKVSVKALESPKKIKPVPLKKKEKTKRVSIEDAPKIPQPETPSVPAFKARPMPSFVGRNGRGGLTGVPKVQKRPLTVPQSPVLGVRRSSSMNEKNPLAFDEKTPVEENHTTLLSGTSMTSPSRGSDLCGLVVLLESHPEQSVENDENLRPETHSEKGFQLQSTVRAKERADYNARRDEKMRQKKEEVMKSRQREVRKLEKELIALRTKI